MRLWMLATASIALVAAVVFRRRRARPNASAAAASPATPARMTTTTTTTQQQRTIRAVTTHDAIALDSSDIALLGLRRGARWTDVQQQQSKHEKLVLWVRHGEGVHNAAEREVGKEHWEAVEAKLAKYFDPDLNAVGVDQARVLHGAFVANPIRVDLIVVSPLLRAIRTAEIALAHIWNETPVVAVELVRERFGKNICDRRRPVAELKDMFPHINFDQFMVSEEDPWWTELREGVPDLQERVKQFTAWLMDQSAQTVVVVGHSDYMSNAVEVVGLDPHWPANCEVVPMILTRD